MNTKNIAEIIRSALKTGNYQVIDCGFHKKKPIDPMTITIKEEEPKEKITMTI